MRMSRRLAVVTAAGVLAATAVSATSAAWAGQASPSRPSAAVQLRGGQTSVVTAPGIASALLGAGIAPIALLPGTAGARITKSGAAVRFQFPVTGGSASLKPLAATIRHQGGILFLDLKTGKKISVSSFTINLGKGVLTGLVNGDPHARVPLFRLSLKHAVLTSGHHFVAARGIVVRLTAVAAHALDVTFGTSLFKGGLLIGWANSNLRF